MPHLPGRLCQRRRNSGPPLQPHVPQRMCRLVRYFSSRQLVCTRGKTDIGRASGAPPCDIYLLSFLDKSNSDRLTTFICPSTACCCSSSSHPLFRPLFLPWCHFHFSLSLVFNVPHAGGWNEGIHARCAKQLAADCGPSLAVFLTRLN
jgi:hypothetical protein